MTTFTIHSHNADIYKGADFVFKFRLGSCGQYLDVTGGDIVMKIAEKAGGTTLFTLDTAAGITIDGDDITATLTDTQVDTLTDTRLYYRVDFVDQAGVITPYFDGILTVHEDA